MSIVLSRILVACTIGLTIYGQLVTKWQVTQAGALPTDHWDKFIFLLKLAFNPWMLSVFLGAFLASLCWMGAMSQLQLSTTYPFTSLSFIIVILLSAILYNEPLNWYKIVGPIIVIAGLIITSRG